MKRNKNICSNCGEESIVFDGTVTWDSEHQRFIAVGSNDHNECTECGETNTCEIVDIPEKELYCKECNRSEDLSFNGDVEFDSYHNEFTEMSDYNAFCNNCFKNVEVDEREVEK